MASPDISSTRPADKNLLDEETNTKLFVAMDFLIYSAKGDMNNPMIRQTMLERAAIAEKLLTEIRSSLQLDMDELRAVAKDLHEDYART